MNINQVKKINIIKNNHPEIWVDDVSIPDVEIKCAEHSQVVLIEIFDAENKHLSAKRNIELANSSKMHLFRIFIGRASLDCDHEFVLSNNAELTVESVMYVSSNDRMNLRDNCVLKKDLAKVSLSVSAMANDRSVVNWSSFVHIEPNTKNTEADLDMHLQLLSKEASGTMLPALNISAHEVSAKHSASSRQLSVDDIFYLNSRGLAGDELRRSIVLSTFRSLVAKIPDQNIANKISGLVHKRV